MLHVSLSFIVLVLTGFLVGYEDGYSDEEGGVASAVVIGLIVGLINYFSPLLTEPVLWLAPVFLVIMLGLLVYFAIWWERHGEKSLGAMLPMLLLMAILFIVSINATLATMNYWNTPMWESIALVPTIFVGCFSIGFVVGSFFIKDGAEGGGKK